MSAPDQIAAAESGLLEVRGLVKRFGGVTAVNALNMTVRAGDIHAMIVFMPRGLIGLLETLRSRFARRDPEAA